MNYYNILLLWAETHGILLSSIGHNSSGMMDIFLL